MRGRDAGDTTVGVCIVRTECVPGARRVTVTVTPDISGPAGLPEHPVTSEGALNLVAQFLSASCLPLADVAGTDRTA